MHDHQIGLLIEELLQSRFRGFCFFKAETCACKRKVQQFPNFRFVLDDQDMGCDRYVSSVMAVRRNQIARASYLIATKE